jgi:thiol-disulfide isomerase/thioredoxin
MAAWLPVTASVLAFTGIASVWAAGGDCTQCTAPASTTATITTTEAAETPADPVLAEQEVIVLKFHADWCPKCKSLDPVYDASVKNFADKPVGFVKLDVTNKEKTKASGEKMKALGLEDVWAKNKGKNGFIMLVDADSKKSVKVLKAGTTEKQATKAINNALDS